MMIKHKIDECESENESTDPSSAEQFNGKSEYIPKAREFDLKFENLSKS